MNLNDDSNSVYPGILQIKSKYLSASDHYSGSWISNFANISNYYEVGIMLSKLSTLVTVNTS